MPSNSVRIDDYEAWGNLVKSWATGENRMGGTTPIPIPHDLDELLSLCSSLGINMTLDPAVKSLAILRYSEEVLTIKLPPKSMVKQTEAELSTDGGEYPLPPFYDQIYENSAEATKTPLTLESTEDRLKFHAQRIGDYSVQNCG